MAWVKMQVAKQHVQKIYISHSMGIRSMGMSSAPSLQIGPQFKARFRPAKNLYQIDKVPDAKKGQKRHTRISVCMPTATPV